MTLAVLPQADELEVSLFGPGVGECVVVHLGHGEWIVVDSCINPETRLPAALEYLQTLGINPAQAVTHVIVSHWHDDHTRGISRVLDAATQAKLVCSSALRREEFKELIAASASLNMKAEQGSGVDEIATALSIVKARRQGGGSAATTGPKWAHADMLLHRRTTSNGQPDCEVWALSPSSQTQTRSLLDIAELLPKPGEQRRAVVNVEPNDTALVISVRFGQAQAVLGSDLESGTSPGTGWSAVLTTTARPAAPVHTFKVPHHGSQNAYHSGQWSNLLAPDAFAVVTPYSTGRKPLPTDADLARLKGHTQHVYCTAPHAGKASFADPVVQRTVGEVAKTTRTRAVRLGHVRVRMPANQPAPRVELFGAAFAA